VLEAAAQERREAQEVRLAQAEQVERIRQQVETELPMALEAAVQRTLLVALDIKA
jgi:hypothetical protein